MKKASWLGLGLADEWGNMSGLEGQMILKKVRMKKRKSKGKKERKKVRMTVVRKERKKD